MLAPGSYLVISVGYDGEKPPGEDFTDAYNAQDGSRIYRQSRDGVNALDVLPPGVVDASTWRAEQPGDAPAGHAAMILAGVARVHPSPSSTFGPIRASTTVMSSS